VRLQFGYRLDGQFQFCSIPGGPGFPERRSIARNREASRTRKEQADGRAAQFDISLAQFVQVEPIRLFLNAPLANALFQLGRWALPTRPRTRMEVMNNATTKPK